jgi:CSLREA domain-containing protein
MSQPALRHRLPLIFVLAVIALAAGAGLTPRETAHAATLIVNDAGDADDGTCNVAHCTLREAIIAANVDPSSPDTIVFDLGPGTHVIAPTSGLPIIFGRTTIDGFCPVTCDASPNTAALWQPINATYSIILSGHSTLGLQTGLRIGSHQVTVRGLVIHRWFRGIAVSGGATARIAGNFIGTNATGDASGPGNATGIDVTDSDDVIIGGALPEQRNLISANNEGIRAASGNATSVRIYGNYIGTDATGTQDLGNTPGILLQIGDNHEVGDADGTGRGNLISGNGLRGIDINMSDNVIIRGNRIGTDRTGTASIPNTAGILAQNAPGLAIGGDVPGSGNLVSGNLSLGVQIVQTDGFLAGHNLIGTNLAGTTALPNGGAGLSISEVDNGVVDDNVIAGNFSDGAGEPAGVIGIDIAGISMERNLVGIGSDGSAIGNEGAGIQLSGELGTIRIGEPGNANIIGAN